MSFKDIRWPSPLKLFLDIESEKDVADNRTTTTTVCTTTSVCPPRWTSTALEVTDTITITSPVVGRQFTAAMWTSSEPTDTVVVSPSFSAEALRMSRPTVTDISTIPVNRRRFPFAMTGSSEGTDTFTSVTQYTAGMSTATEATGDVASASRDSRRRFPSVDLYRKYFSSTATTTPPSESTQESFFGSYSTPDTSTRVPSSTGVLSEFHAARLRSPILDITHSGDSNQGFGTGFRSDSSVTTEIGGRKPPFPIVSGHVDVPPLRRPLLSADPNVSRRAEIPSFGREQRPVYSLANTRSHTCGDSKAVTESSGSLLPSHVLDLNLSALECKCSPFPTVMTPTEQLNRGSSTGWMPLGMLLFSQLLTRCLFETWSTLN